MIGARHEQWETVHLVVCSNLEAILTSRTNLVSIERSKSISAISFDVHSRVSDSASIKVGLKAPLPSDRVADRYVRNDANGFI